MKFRHEYTDQSRPGMQQNYTQHCCEYLYYTPRAICAPTASEIVRAMSALEKARRPCPERPGVSARLFVTARLAQNDRAFSRWVSVKGRRSAASFPPRGNCIPNISGALGSFQVHSPIVLGKQSGAMVDLTRARRAGQIPPRRHEHRKRGARAASAMAHPLPGRPALPGGPPGVSERASRGSPCRAEARAAFERAAEEAGLLIEGLKIVK